MASALSIPGMEEAGMCPICMELFADPVTLDCGHNVCWVCLTDYCETWKDMEDLGCPVCRVRIKDRKFQPNWHLANAVENILLLQKYLCVKHMNELSLSCKIKKDEVLCREDERLLCVACERSPEQGQPIFLLEKVSQECEEDIQAELHFLQKKREKLMKQKVAKKQRSQRCLGTQAASPNKATNTPPSIMASASPVTDVEEEAKCPICLEVLMDPVTLGCHHNFCRGCITDYCDKWEDLGDLECPVCRIRIKGRKFQRNYQLANIVENVQRAKKRLCAQHLKELNLFCKEDDELLCVACWRSPEHQLHTVLLLEEAAQEYKENIQEQLQSLQKKREELAEQKESEEQRIQECLKQLRLEKLEIISLFEQMHKFLEEKKHVWLMELTDLEKEIWEREEENMTRLSEEISHFSDLIKDVEVKCQPPPSEFLQDIRCTLSRCQEGQERERLELYPELEWRVRSFGLKSSALKRAKEQFEGSLNQVPGKVSVTLDPDTAHPSLLVSEDLKSVRCENTNQNLADNPERFDTMPCVLGRESFTSGRHWWEVEVKMWSLIFIRVKEFLFGRECGMWCAGVARESLRRKGDLIIRPDGGIWSVGEDPFRPYPFLDFTPPKLSPATLRPLPRKIRIFLDYEEGCVEFFDADTDALIFAFPPATFSGEVIRPFFRVQEGACLQC